MSGEAPPEEPAKGGGSEARADRYGEELKGTTRQAGLVFGARVGGYLLAFGGQAVFARLLGADAFGLFALGMTVVAVAALLAVFGMSTGLPRYLGELLTRGDRASAAALARSSMAVSVVAAVVVSVGIAVFREPLALHVLKEAALAPVLPWFAGMVVLQTVGNTLQGLLQGVKQPSVAFFAREITQRGVQFGAFLVLYLAGLQLGGLLIGTAVALAVASASMGWWLLRRMRWLWFETGPVEPGVKASFLKFSGGMFFVALAMFLTEHVNKLLLGFFLDAKEVGLYTIAFSVASLCVFFLQSFNSIFSVKIAELYHTGQQGSLAQMYATVTRWVMTLTLPLMLWIVFFAEEILSVFGPDFQGAATVLRLLAIGQFVNTSAGPCGFLLVMTKFQRVEMLNGVIIAGLNVGLNLALIPWLHIEGAALAGMVALSGINMLRVAQVRWRLGMHPYTRAYLKPITAGAAVALALFGAQQLDLGVLGAVLGGVVAYAVMLLVLWALRLESDDAMIVETIQSKFGRLARRR